MGRLVYSSIMSLDGYVADKNGNFDWAAPEEEVHAFVNDLERPIGTYLYGRRMYEVMRFWETASIAGEPDVFADFAAIWSCAEKIVFSRTLAEVSTAKTSLEREFDAASIRRLKRDAPGDISIGGPTLAAGAIRAGLAEEFHFIVAPVLVGGGTRSLPDGALLHLELQDQRRFAGGAVHLHYRARQGSRSALRF